MKKQMRKRIEIILSNSQCKSCQHIEHNIGNLPAEPVPETHLPNHLATK